jgi:hypothetical protein
MDESLKIPISHKKYYTKDPKYFKFLENNLKDEALSFRL